MSRITNYTYTRSGLLKQIEREGDVTEIIRPEDQAKPVEGEISIDDASSKVQTSGFEVKIEAGDQGTIRKVIYPSGKTVSTVFNKQLQPIYITSDEQEVSMTYDEDGRMIKRKDEKKGTLEVFEYEGNHLIKHKDGEGRFTLWDYEDDLQTRKSLMNYQKDDEGKYVTDEKGKKIEQVKVVEERQYNDFGQIESVNCTSGMDQTFTYDHHGNLSEFKNNGQTETFDNDDSGNVVRSVQGNLTKEYLYDSFNRPVEVIENGAKTGYMYDEHMRIIEVIQSNGQSSFFDYDVYDRLIQKRDVNGNTWKYDYDQKGNLKQLTKPDGLSIKYEYDESGNAIKIIAGGEVIEQEFDINNRMIRNKNNLADISREYDLTGMLKEESCLFEEKQEYAVKYNYDRSGLCTKIAAVGQEITFDYDDYGQLIDIESGEFHLGLGTIKNKRPSIFEHDKFKITTTSKGSNETSMLVNKGESKLFEQEYHYNEQGNCISAEVVGQASWLFEYNMFNELTTAELSGHEQNVSYQRTLEYDDLGNRIKENNFELIYDDSKYQLLEDERYKYSYDQNGNLATKENKADGSLTSFEYNAFDLVTAFSRKASDGQVLVEANYGYDGLSRRVRKVVKNHSLPEQSIDKWYIHDVKNVLAELDSEFNTTNFYVGIRELDHSFGFVRNEKAYYYVKGKFGSVQAILDHDGEIVARYTYGPFGELLYENASISNDFLYISREYDRELEAYYIRARHYDPATGRFFQLDPDAGNLHDPRTHLLKYAYGNNNPLRFFDPDGRKSLWEHIGDLWDNYHPFAGFKHGFFAGLVHLIFWPVLFLGALI
ncbi:RHS repeat-associated core domain-containing protein, partial [Reichenbachiella sp.]